MFSHINDLVHAARTLVKARAFTAVCVISLGLGMGVVIAILLLMRMVLATPPGVNEQGLAELVIRPSGPLRAQAGTGIVDTWSYPDYLDVRDAASGMVITGWSRGEGLVRLPDQSGGDTGADDVRVEQLFLDRRRHAGARAGLHSGGRCVARRAGSGDQPSAWQMRFDSDPQHHRARDHGQPVRVCRRRRGAGAISAATSAGSTTATISSGCRCRIIRG